MSRVGANDLADLSAEVAAVSGDVSESALPPAADGRLIAGRFRLLESLGRGGMGRVYRAQDELLGRLVAVKLIYDDAIVDSDVRHACALEARAAARLNHPGIVRILDSGFDDGHLYVVMSLAEGRTLAEIIRTEGPISTVRALEIAAQVADALEAAHQEGIIHCDVKPGNLIVRPDGTVQLVDFGIAKIAASTTSLDSSTLQGSAEYVAPEQVEGAAVDGRTDLYALGVVLFESLTRRTPFGGGTIASVLARRLVNDPPGVREFRPGVPPAVERLVRRMLAREPSGRFQTAAELRDALLAARMAARSATLPAPPVPPPTATMPLPRARTAALRARAERVREAALRHQASINVAGQRAGVALAAGGLAALRSVQAFFAGVEPAVRSQLVRLQGVPGWSRPRTRRPSLASSFGIAIVLGLLIGTAAARCNVAGAATATALTPETASAATVDAVPAPPVPILPPPAPTMPPPTVATDLTPTPLPPPMAPVAPTSTPPLPTSEPAAEPETAPLPAPARAAPPPTPPAQVLVAVPAASEGRAPDEKQSESRRSEDRQPDARKPEVKKPENTGSPGRAVSRGGDEKPKSQGRGNGNGQQKKR
jgi:eukaryotic-like serine/threonine-protein kinase